MTDKKAPELSEVFWADGLRLPKRPSAKVAYERLEEIRLKKGGGELRPIDLVEEARDEKSIFHGMFIWDDTTAARKYREGQASLIIRSVRVTYKENGHSKPHRVYVHVSKGTEDSRYQTMARALSDEETRERLLTQAKSEARTWMKRYAELEELAELFKVLEKFVAA